MISIAGWDSPFQRGDLLFPAISPYSGDGEENRLLQHRAPAGLVMTLLYFWKRDLTVNMVAHFITDFMSVFIASVASH